MEVLFGLTAGFAVVKKFCITGAALCNAGVGMVTSTPVIIAIPVIIRAVCVVAGCVVRTFAAAPAGASASVVVCCFQVVYQYPPGAHICDIVGKVARTSASAFASMIICTHESFSFVIFSGIFP